MTISTLTALPEQVAQGRLDAPVPGRLDAPVPGDGEGRAGTPHPDAGSCRSGNGRVKMPRRSRRGISIFGVILGVAVAALVTAGLVSAYNGVLTNVRAGEVQNTVISALANVRRAFTNATTFVGGEASINATIYSSAPANFQNTDGSTRDAGITFPYWEGTSKLIASTTGSEYDEDMFTLHLVDIPPEVCETVGAIFVGDNSVEEIAIAETPLIATPGHQVAATGVDLADKCAEVGTDDLVDLKIQFRG